MSLAASCRGFYLPHSKPRRTSFYIPPFFPHYPIFSQGGHPHFSGKLFACDYLI